MQELSVLKLQVYRLLESGTHNLSLCPLHNLVQTSMLSNGEMPNIKYDRPALSDILIAGERLLCWLVTPLSIWSASETLHNKAWVKKQIQEAVTCW